MTRHKFIALVAPLKVGLQAALPRPASAEPDGEVVLSDGSHLADAGIVALQLPLTTTGEQ